MKKLFVLFSLMSFSLSAMPLQARANDKIEPKTIRATPGAPRFSDAERQTELATPTRQSFRADGGRFDDDFVQRRTENLRGRR
jgi:hypothetical protein